jgi:hypothetical protein
LAGLIIILTTCQNPYTIENLKREVVMKGVEFKTDADDPGEGPYALKPVFNENIKYYEVFIHERATMIIPGGYPEDGASLSFGPGRYIQVNGSPAVDDYGTELPPVAFVNGAYAFPPDMFGIRIPFTVHKEYRDSTEYTILVKRRADPGRLNNFVINAAWYDQAQAGAVSKADINDPGWIYETDNYMVNFDSAGTDYQVKLPYYAQKILIKPEPAADVVIAYHLYAEDPQYYPEIANIPWEDAANPLYIDYTADAVEPYVKPQLRVSAPLLKSGAYTSYLRAVTSTHDSLTGDLRNPTMYNFKLVWDKSYAYLRELHVTDDKAPAERLVGNFIMNNDEYDAVVDADAASIDIAAVVRDAASTVTYEKWDAGKTTQLAGPLGPAVSANFPFDPATEPAAALRVIVDNPSDAISQKIYWINVTRSAPPTHLTNLKIEGQITSTIPGHPEYSPGQWYTLYWRDKGAGVEEIDAYILSFKEIPGTVVTPPPFFDNNPGDEDDTNYSIEIDGAIGRLRLTGTAEAGGTVSYNIGDDPSWDPQQNEFVFSGGAGATITASLSGRKDRLYAFTLIRAGALAIELLTDTRLPETGYPPFTGSAQQIEEAKKDNWKPAHRERGTFEAMVGGKSVGNALVGARVTLRVIPRLGWKVDAASLIVENGAVPPAVISTGPTETSAGSGIYEWDIFAMPNQALKLVIQYNYVTEKVARVAYCAPNSGTASKRAGRSGAYGTGPDLKTGTAWAFATSNLQGVINEFKEDGSGPFDEIWLLEGMYYLDYLDSGGAPAGDWAEGIDNQYRADNLNRSFVLKKTLRIYGGFKGTEGTDGTTVTTLQEARELRDDSRAAALRTILSGKLRGASEYARHVVIAADIASPPDDNPLGRSNLDDANGYGFDPDQFTLTSGGVFGGAGVTLLDTLTIRDGLRTKDPTVITVRSRSIRKDRGAGLYNIDSSLWLRNVVISDNTAAMGGGMYNTGTGDPVMKSVLFTTNDTTGYLDNTGDGAGMAHDGGGLPALIECEFKNNSTIGGSGAGLYTSSGAKILLRGVKFENNTTSLSGALYNSGSTWVYESEFNSNEAYDTGSGVYNLGTLKLVNVTLQNNRIASALANGGTLTATNITVQGNAAGGISNGSSLALVNSRVKGNGTGISISGGASVLANVVIDGNSGAGLSFGVANGEKDELHTVADPLLGGCILTNVSIFGNGGAGLAASYNSIYSYHEGAANLLLNSVRLNNNAGGGLSLSSNVAYPEGARGLYVTLNNVTIAKNSSFGLNTNSGAANLLNGLAVRVRNSLIFGNNGGPGITTGVRPVLGTFPANINPEAGVTYAVRMTREQAELINVGDTVRVASGGADGVLKTPVNTVTAKTPMAMGDYDRSVTVSFTASAADSYGTGDWLVLSGYNTNIGTIGAANSGSLNTGTNTWTLDEGQVAQLSPGTAFKIKSALGTWGTSVNTVTGRDTGLNTVTFTATGADSFVAGDSIVTNSVRQGAGAGFPALTTDSGGQTWKLTQEQANLFQLGATFRITRDPARRVLYPSVNTVRSFNTIDSEISFTSTQGDTFTDYGRMILTKGAVNIGASSTLVETPAVNTCTLAPGQAASLQVGDTFRIAAPPPANTLGESLNTITGVDTSTGTITFTATHADTFASGASLVIVKDVPGTIGAANVPGALTAGPNTNTRVLAPYQAALLQVGDKFRLAQGSSDGTLRDAKLKVTAVYPAEEGKLTFTVISGTPGAWTSNDYIVFPDEALWTRLPGYVEWYNSMAGGVEKTLAGSLISGTGKTVSSVFVAADTANFRVSDSALVDQGNDSYYPASAQAMADQCLQQYTEKGAVTSGLNGWLKGLLENNLYIWEGALVPKDITYFLVRDNGFNQGDLRNPYLDPAGNRLRKSGVIDVGAYEN